MLLKTKERALDFSEFNWRESEPYQRLVNKGQSLRDDEQRLATDLEEWGQRVFQQQEMIDQLQLAAMAGQASDAQINQAMAALHEAVKRKEAIGDELTRIRRLLPGLDAIEADVAKTIRGPYAQRLKDQYKIEVEALGHALRAAARANARVNALHRFGVLEFENRELSVDPRVSGLPTGQWSELDVGDADSKLSRWLKEFQSYGLEV